MAVFGTISRKIPTIVSLVMSGVVLTGCATSGQPDTGSDPYSRGTGDPYASNEAAAAEAEAKELEQNQNDISAYEYALEQILLDFRGKMQATEGATFKPPVKQCNVWIPSQRAGHAVYPEHKGCVLIAPGYYSQDRPVFLPIRGGEQ